MASLIVRGIEDSLVQALKERATSHGRSAEAEHRAILVEMLQRPQRRSFAEVLSNMPNIGLDEDFARVDDSKAASHVFD